MFHLAWFFLFMPSYSLSTIRLATQESTTAKKSEIGDQGRVIPFTIQEPVYINFLTTENREHIEKNQAFIRLCELSVLCG